MEKVLLSEVLSTIRRIIEIETSALRNRGLRRTYKSMKTYGRTQIRIMKGGEEHWLEVAERKTVSARA